MKKILIHLHVYYEEYLQDILKKITAIHETAFIKLIVTYMPFHPKKDLIRQKVLSAFPNAELMEVENRGFDIYPFIEALKHTDLIRYDYVLKLHTKGKENKGGTFLNGFVLNDYQWTTLIEDALILNKKQFCKALSELENKKVGMVGAKVCLIEDDYLNNDFYLNRVNGVLQELNMLSIDRLTYFAGSMFLAKTHLFLPILRFNGEMFEPSDSSYKDKSFAHVCERLFGAVVVSQGFTLDGLEVHSVYLKYHFFLETMCCKSKRILNRVYYRFYRKKLIKILKSSELFNVQRYVEHYDWKKGKYSCPEEHYLLWGGFNEYDPSEYFSSEKYFKYNPDVKKSGLNPLIHYLQHGFDEHRMIGGTNSSEEPNLISRGKQR